MVYIISFLIGIIAAFIGSLAGLGGGIILIPSLLLLNQFVDAFSWATPQKIVGISLIVMIVTALSSTISYAKKKRVDYKTGRLFLYGSIPGGVMGSWLNQFVNADKFSLYFGILMIVLSLLFFVKRKSPPAKDASANDKTIRTFQVDEKAYRYAIPFWSAFIISLIVGTVSGLFGIGGGSIMVPAMIILFGIPAHIAAATSMFMIFFISIISASTHIILGHISWGHVIFFVPGAWIGGTIGARANQWLKGNTLEWILRILLVIIGFRLIFEGL